MAAFLVQLADDGEELAEDLGGKVASPRFRPCVGVQDGEGDLLRGRFGFREEADDCRRARRARSVWSSPSPFASSHRPAHRVLNAAFALSHLAWLFLRASRSQR